MSAIEHTEIGESCVICGEGFDKSYLKLLTLKGEAVLVCGKCAKTAADSFDKCVLCKNANLTPEELGYYVIDGEHQLLCDSCAREHDPAIHTERCDVCKKPHFLKDLTISCRDEESCRVCKKCSTCSLCGNVYELSNLWHGVLLDGNGGIVCANCARCAKCDESNDPNEMVELVVDGKWLLICASCAECEACSKPDDPHICRMNGNGELECESCSKIMVLNVGEEDNKIMDKIEKTVKFKVEKETKNTVKYNEVPAEGQPPIIGTLYVQKWFAGNAAEIEVTIRK